MKSYIVIGLGRFGEELALQLGKLGAEVLAMDVCSENVQRVSPRVTHAVVGDAKDKEVLRALGARNFDCAVVAIGEDLAASVLISMNLMELGVPYVVCKAHDETYQRVLEKLGVNRVVIPEKEKEIPQQKSIFMTGVWAGAFTGTMCWTISSCRRNTAFSSCPPPKSGWAGV